MSANAKIKKVMLKLTKDIEAVFAKWPTFTKKKIANKSKNRQ